MWVLFVVPYGAVAQLVAHLHGMEGVRGSSPLSSTNDQLPHFSVRGLTFTITMNSSVSGTDESGPPSAHQSTR